MRISTYLSQQGSVTAMLDQQSQMNRTQLQLSSGKRILAPSDDPTGSSRALELGQTKDMTEQYLKNAETVKTRLNLQDTTLAAMNGVMQRVRQLAVQGLNDTNTVLERTGIAIEIRERIKEMMGLANTTDANGDYMFAGYKGDTVPISDLGGGVYAYNGDQGVREVQIGSTRDVAIGNSGYEVFMKIPAAAGGFQDVFATLDTLATDLEANAPVLDSLVDIDSAMENFGMVRTSVGSRINAIDGQINVNESYKIELESAVSDISDLEYTEAISRFNLQMVGMQAAQQAYTRVQGLSLFNYL